MLYFVAAAVAVLSYLLGSINPSILLSKAIYGDDIRSHGSGNAGTTNMLRTHGKGIAAVTLLCDILKGTLAVAVAMWLDIIFSGENSALAASDAGWLIGNLRYLAGAFVVLGHDFPIYFGFRGGKGVATSFGVVLILNWQVALILMIVEVVVIIFSRYVSLGSISAAGAYPFILFTFLLASGENLDKSIGHIAMSFVLALLLIAKHHQNIAKLTKGTENKIFAKKQEPLPETAFESDCEAVDEE